MLKRCLKLLRKCHRHRRPPLFELEISRGGVSGELLDICGGVFLPVSTRENFHKNNEDNKISKMNSVIRSFLRGSSGVKQLLNPVKNVKLNVCSNRQLARNLWYMCNSKNVDQVFVDRVKVMNPSQLCSCGCGIVGIHTKGTRQLHLLFTFLTSKLIWIPFYFIHSNLKISKINYNFSYSTIKIINILC